MYTFEEYVYSIGGKRGLLMGKLRKSEIKAIIWLLSDNIMPQSQIARLFNVSRQLISLMKMRYMYKIPYPYDSLKAKRRYLESKKRKRDGSFLGVK
ncbi:MAG: hypothetical protein WC750_06465 [Patescibacteria group bacterium]|jgi:hypothetical protein